MGCPDAHGSHDDQHITSDVVAGNGRRHAPAAAGPSLMMSFESESCCSHRLALIVNVLRQLPSPPLRWLADYVFTHALWGILLFGKQR